jgi:hypothetical protein
MDFTGNPRPFVYRTREELARLREQQGPFFCAEKSISMRQRSRSFSTSLPEHVSVERLQSRARSMPANSAKALK